MRVLIAVLASLASSGEDETDAKLILVVKDMSIGIVSIE
jgi:hypothetical protein